MPSVIDANPPPPSTKKFIGLNQDASIGIAVSGGFDPEKIRRFERERVPVDSYGVGSSLFAGNFDFTADIVTVDGRPVSKQGRRHRPNPRLERVK